MPMKQLVCLGNLYQHNDATITELPELVQMSEHYKSGTSSFLSSRGSFNSIDTLAYIHSTYCISVFVSELIFPTVKMFQFISIFILYNFQDT